MSLRQRFRAVLTLPATDAIVLIGVLLIPVVLLSACSFFEDEAKHGTLIAIDARTGEELWSVRADSAAIGSLAATGDLVFTIGGDDCSSEKAVIAAYSATSGELQWRDQGLGTCMGSRTNFGAGEDVIVARHDDGLRGLDAGTGEELWSATGDGDDPLLLDTDDLVVQLSHALDRRTGEQRWTASSDWNDAYPFPMVVDRSTAYLLLPIEVPVSPYEGCAVAAIDLTTGQQRWKFELGEGERAGCEVVAQEGTVAACAVDFSGTPEEVEASAVLVALDDQTGREIWRQPGPPLACYAMAADGDQVYVYRQDPKGPRVQAFDATSGAINWEFTPVGISGPIAAAGSGVVVVYGTSLEGDTAFALDSATGEQLWEVPVPDSTFRGPRATIASDVVYIAASGKPVNVPEGN